MYILAGLALGLLSVVYYRRHQWHRPKNDHYIGNRFAEEERRMREYYNEK